jgi:hypothetical protein
MFLFCEPEVQPEVRFEKRKFLARARSHCDEMLNFHSDELRGEGYRTMKRNKTERETLKEQKVFEKSFKNLIRNMIRTIRFRPQS